jgi:hypothetical protein
MSSQPPPETESEIHHSGGPRASLIPWDLVAVLVASGAYLAFFYRIPPSTTDEGMIAAGAERILRGQIPYRDFFSELGPGSYYLQAAIFHLFGISVSSFRFTAWAMGAVLSGLIYLLGKHIIRGPAAFVPPFIFTTTCYSYLFFVSHHWWANFFFLLELVCLVASVHILKEGGSLLQRTVLFCAGVLAAFTLLCMQPKGAWAIITGVTFLILSEMLVANPTLSPALRAGFGKMLWFLFGAGGALALVAGNFGFRDALGAWIFDNFTFLFTNYLPYENQPGVYSWARVIHDLRWVARNLSFQNLSHVLGFYFFSVVGPAIGFMSAIWRIKRYGAARLTHTRLLLLFLLGGIGSLISELHEPNIIHLVWASPIILILFVDAANEAIRGKGAWRSPTIVAATLTIGLVIAVASRRVVQISGRRAPVYTRRGTLFMDPGTESTYQEWIDTIERDVPAGGETFIFPYDAQFYFLTATHNPSKYDVLISDFHSKRQFDEAISILDSRRPGFVFGFDMLERLSPRAHYQDDPADFNRPDLMEESLRSPQGPYRLAETVEDMEVWVLKK